MAHFDYEIIYGMAIAGRHVEEYGLTAFRDSLWHADSPVPAHLRGPIVSDRDAEAGHGCGFYVGASLDFLEEREVVHTGITPARAVRLAPTDEERAAVADAVSRLPEELLACPHLTSLGVYFIRCT